MLIISADVGTSRHYDAPQTVLPITCNWAMIRLFRVQETLLDIRFGIATPTTMWSIDLPARAQMLSNIYDEGFDHIYMADHVSFRNGSGNDGFVEIAALSQLHPKLKVMPSVYLLPLRHPLPVARQLATMARIAPGRTLFGIGIGGDDRHEVEICGVDPSTRGARTNESLHIIRGLLAGDEVSFDGKHFQIEAAKIRPTPKDPIPIIVGGRSDAALKRAGRYGDGWIGVWCSPDRYAKAVNLVSEACAEAGRDEPDWLHGYQPWIGIDQDRDRARAAVARGMEDFYRIPFEQFERYTPYGTPIEIAEQLAPYAQAGCRIFNLKVVTHDPSAEVELGAQVKSELEKMI